jgi:hypothetical protein
MSTKTAASAGARTALSVYAAGATGIRGHLLLIGFYALAGRRVIAGLGLVLPRQWPRLVSGLGGLLVVLAILGIPIWYLLLGRHLARSVSTATSSPPALTARHRLKWTDT